MSEIRENDIGTTFIVTIVDSGTGAAIDISAATTKVIKFMKPDKSTVLEKTAVFDSDGTDGKIKYISIANDLTPKGTWTIQGYVVDGNFTNHSETDKFVVRTNLS